MHDVVMKHGETAVAFVKEVCGEGGERAQEVIGLSYQMYIDVKEAAARRHCVKKRP